MSLVRHHVEPNHGNFSLSMPKLSFRASQNRSKNTLETMKNVSLG